MNKLNESYEQMDHENLKQKADKLTTEVVSVDETKAFEDIPIKKFKTDVQDTDLNKPTNEKFVFNIDSDNSYNFNFQGSMKEDCTNKSKAPFDFMNFADEDDGMDTSFRFNF